MTQNLNIKIIKKLLFSALIALIACNTNRSSAFLSYFSDDELINKVLLIGIDGLSSTRLHKYDLPNLEKLIRNGLYISNTKVNSMPSKSGPGWSDILTGVNNSKHKVVNNRFEDKKFNLWPDFLNRLEVLNPDINTYAITNWVGFDHIFEETDIDYYFRSKVSDVRIGDELVKDKTIQILKYQSPDAIFTYFNRLDVQGHNFGGSSAEYEEAAETIDSHIGKIIKYVNYRRKHFPENWLILIASDHGHTDKGGHGGNSHDEMSVFMILEGPSVVNRLNIQTDNTFFAPTAISHVLGYYNSNWGLDGKVVGINKE